VQVCAAFTLGEELQPVGFISWPKLLPSLSETKLANFAECFENAKHCKMVMVGGPTCARACRLHSKFHDGFWELCLLIYKSCR
jgi:hypothetical protein